MHSFIPSKKNLPNIHYVPGTVISAEDTPGSQTDKNPCLPGADILVEEAINEYI